MTTLRIWRQQRGLTLQQTADRLGLGSPQVVSRYERGELWPGREAMRRIVIGTGGAVTADSFLGLEAA